MTMETERRGLSPLMATTKVETRAEGRLTLSGYAAVFYRSDNPDTEFRLWDGAVERVKPGAFTEALRSDDPAALFNHDPSHVLGRLSAGTLRLEQDEIGLRYEVDLDPDDAFDQRLAKRIDRGDLRGSSFGFIDNERTWENDGTQEIRHLVNVSLLDVGPVTYPAYTGTSTDVAQRSASAWRGEIIAAQKRNRDALARRLNLARLRQHPSR